MPNARDVEDWLNLENELPTSPQMSDEEILAAVVGDSTESGSVCSDEEDEGEDDKLVSTEEAAQCFKKCLSWMESQNDVDAVQLMQLRRMMDFAMRSTYKSLKQTNMLEHFNVCKYLNWIFLFVNTYRLYSSTIKMFCLRYTFCLHFFLINIHIFDYPDSRLYGLFTEVPTSLDNRGSTVFI